MAKKRKQLSEAEMAMFNPAYLEKHIPKQVEQATGTHIVPEWVNKIGINASWEKEGSILSNVHYKP